MRRILIIFVVIFCWANFSWAALFGGKVGEGNKLFERGDYGQAAEKYKEALKKDQNSDIINFNLGTALYKNKEYDQAVEQLQRSLLSDDEKLRGKAGYNLGNALYKSGIAREKSDLPKAIQSLEQSLKNYERTLAVDKEDKDARYNYEFVKKELERLKKKQEQQQQKHDQQKQQSKDNQPQDQDQKRNQEQEKQDSNEQEQKEQAGEQSQDPKEMSAKEAERLLKDYQEGEPVTAFSGIPPTAVTGRLNLQPRAAAKERPVIKDW